MQFPKIELAVLTNNTWWSFLKTWDQMKTAPFQSRLFLFPSCGEEEPTKSWDTMASWNMTAKYIWSRKQLREYNSISNCHPHIDSGFKPEKLPQNPTIIWSLFPLGRSLPHSAAFTSQSASAMGSFASQSSPKQTNPTKLFASHPNYLLEVTGKRDFLCLKQLSPLGFLHSPGGGR